MPNKGFLTPSSFAALMSNGRGSVEMGKTALAVVDQLVLDMIGAERAEQDDSAAPVSCAWGKENEWLAIQQYIDLTLSDVRIDTFTVSQSHPYIGGTMDGKVGQRGGIEVKCPYSQLEHLANLEYGKQIKQYMCQMQGYMFINELDWVDFVSFSPLFPEDIQLFIKRVQRDNELIEQIVKRCEVAHQMALDKVKRLGVNLSA